MTYFLTSSPCTAAGLNPANGFVEALLEALPGPCRRLFICSDPEGHDGVEALHGEAYCIEDGVLRKISQVGNVLPL